MYTGDADRGPLKRERKNNIRTITSILTVLQPAVLYELQQKFSLKILESFKVISRFRLHYLI